MTPPPPLVQVSHLSVDYGSAGGLLDWFRRDHRVRAVDDISFDIRASEVLALVGESGSGKTSTGRAVVRLQPTADGRIRFQDRDVTSLRGTELRRLRREMQIIFQDPYSSLDPRMTVQDTITEPLIVHRLLRGPAREARVRNLMRQVGFDPRLGERKAHELSGGQRQRVGIARALAVEPRFIVCDEPVSALDASIQAQILNLLMDLRSELGLTYLFIAHNLGVVKHISDRVAVMYLGKIVELGETKSVFSRPSHPYTAALLSAAPIPDPTLERASSRQRLVLRGEMPSAANPPTGCRFHTRCWLYQRLGEPDICRSESPSLGAAKAESDHDTGHVAACHFASELQSSSLVPAAPSVRQ